MFHKKILRCSSIKGLSHAFIDCKSRTLIVTFGSAPPLDMFLMFRAALQFTRFGDMTRISTDGLLATPNDNRCSSGDNIRMLLRLLTLANLSGRSIIVSAFNSEQINIVYSFYRIPIIYLNHHL